MTPRLNAPGRLGDQELTLALLRARTLPEARALAARVEQHNERRKQIEAEVTENAIRQVCELYGENPQRGVVAASEGWHRGVLGISAARLVDRFQVPAVVIGIDEGVGHGSCRAPDGFLLFDAVERCKSELLRFGGHQAASGLTLRAERIEAFRAAFHDATPCDPGSPATYVADVALDGVQYFLPSPSELLSLEPLGEANPEPLFFLPEARVLRSAIVGEHHLKLGLEVGEQRFSAFGARMADRLPDPGQQLCAVGPLRIDTWNGGDQLELRLLDFALA